MKKNSLSSRDGQEKNPSALVSFQYTSRCATDLSEIRQFKNLAELDISSNSLNRGVPELMQLRFLKRLAFSDNKLTRVEELPGTLEVLVLSHNLLPRLQLPNLRKLHTLDVSYNLLTDLDGISSLPGLKCLYATHNQIASLGGLEGSLGLIELDVASNPLSSASALHALELNDSVSILNLKDTPYYAELRKDQIFNTVVEKPFNFEHIEEGLFCRHFEKLKELKSSRFKRKIRKLMAEPEQSASPEWAYSKRTELVEEAPAEPKRKKFELKLVTTEETKQFGESGLSPTDEHAKSTETAARRNSQMRTELEDRAALEQRIEQLEAKLWSHYEGSADSFLDDLIQHCLDRDAVQLSSSRSDKYEFAVAAIKQHEDERRTIMKERQDQVKELERLRAENESLRVQLEDKETRLSLIAESSSPDESQLYIIESKLLTEKRIRAKLTEELKQAQEALERMSLDNEGLKDELMHVSQGFMQKIRELESSRILSATDTESMFSELSLQSDMSHYKKLSEGGKVQINKQVGAYIEKLKAKNTRLLAKAKDLRAQRDKYRQQLMLCSQMLAAVSPSV